MHYALLIYEDEAIYGDEPDSPALQAIIGQHMAFAGSLGAARVGGAGLAGTDSATTVRTTGGVKTVHDGPYAETKEQLGGFYLIEAPDLDAALAIARRVPLAANGAIEVRPLLETPT
ncbi:YciI family protein [Azospirillum sp. B4]|uniref:YciI family protein n=1 Tax=Azospirillum sp. B4 TaxID=95605 RepID=UPI00034BD366|nr:YciI family protein [Azospirillum sp. B4]